MGASVIEEPRDAGPVSGKGKGRQAMKMVSCIVRPERLEAVKEAFVQLGVVGGMMVTDVRGFGRQKGQVEHYRGGEYTIRFLPKVRIDIAVSEEDAESVIAAIRQAAHTGQVGDGKLFISEVHQVVRIRTGERGAIAL